MILRKLQNNSTHVLQWRPHPSCENSKQWEKSAWFNERQSWEFHVRVPNHTEKEVTDIINPLGYDKIDASVLKNVIPAIIAPLTHLGNLSLQSGHVPD